MPSPLKSPVTALLADPETDASGVPNTRANVDVAKPLVSIRVAGDPTAVVPSYSVTVPLGALNGGVTEAPGATSIGMLYVPRPIGTTEISVCEGSVPCARVAHGNATTRTIGRNAENLTGPPTRQLVTHFAEIGCAAEYRGTSLEKATNYAKTPLQTCLESKKESENPALPGKPRTRTFLI